DRFPVADGHHRAAPEVAAEARAVVGPAHRLIDEAHRFAARAMAPVTPKIQHRLRIVFGEDIAIGPGKVDLLEAIDAAGSITAAAKQLGMSYRRAWLLVDTMNRCFTEPLVVAESGAAAAAGHGSPRPVARWRGATGRCRRRPPLLPPPIWRRSRACSPDPAAAAARMR